MNVYFHKGEVINVIVTFCGHSDFCNKQDYEYQLLRLIEEISKGQQIDFYLGGYGNFDYFAKECAKKFKEKHPHSRLIFITPYLNKWLDDRRDYLVKEYDEIIYPDLESVPLKFAISKRNKWMVNQADYVIAYVCTHYGGAYNTLIYAHKRNKPYTNIYNGDYKLF